MPEREKSGSLREQMLKDPRVKEEERKIAEKQRSAAIGDLPSRLSGDRRILNDLAEEYKKLHPDKPISEE